jgi:hypothetical protein
MAVPEGTRAPLTDRLGNAVWTRSGEAIPLVSRETEIENLKLLVAKLKGKRARATY